LHAQTATKPKDLPGILAELATGDLLLQDVARLLAASGELLVFEELQQIHGISRNKGHYFSSVKMWITAIPSSNLY